MKSDISIKCKCGNNYIEVINTYKQLLYCDCGEFIFKDLECEHDYKFVNMILENGNTQLRKLCNKCFKIESKIYKKSECVNAVNKQFSSYNSFIETSQIEIRDLLAVLMSQKNKSFKKQYDEYILSAAWLDKSAKIRVRDNNICQICGNKCDHVHHLTYAHFKNEFDFELVSLCKECHVKEYHSNK